MDLREQIAALDNTADLIGLGYSRDAANAVRHHVAELRAALDEHEKQVRAKVAEEVCAGLQRLRENGETDMRQAIATADSIARGEDQ